MTSSTKTPSLSSQPLVSVIPIEKIDSRIYLLRGEKVLLDYDLAELYGVETKVFNQAVKRNAERFPADFMFQLSYEEFRHLKSQIVTSSSEHGGVRKHPYAFTEQGIAMLSGVLRSPRAIAVNIEIMRSFIRLRQMISGQADLAKKLRALEKKYDDQFKVVFEAIHELMEPITDEDRAREIGFHTTIKTPAPKKS